MGHAQNLAHCHHLWRWVHETISQMRKLRHCSKVTHRAWVKAEELGFKAPHFAASLKSRKGGQNNRGPVRQ